MVSKLEIFILQHCLMMAVMHRNAGSLSEVFCALSVYLDMDHWVSNPAGSL